MSEKDTQSDLVVKLSGDKKDLEQELVEQSIAKVVTTYEELEAELAGVSGCTKMFTSGYFNPIHKNHISNIVSSKKLGDTILPELGLPGRVHLTVVVNGDWSTRDKLGGKLFMSAEHRADVVRALAGVDLVFIHNDQAHHQGNLIKRGLFDVYTKGGDRDFASLPQEEKDALQSTKTLLITNVGFDKLEGTTAEVSSSRLRDASVT